MATFRSKFLSLRAAKKFGKWLLILTAVVLLVWGIRSCVPSEKAKKGSFRIGRDSTWYPIQLFGKEKNLVAFTNDVFDEIGTQNHLRFTWIQTNPSSLIEGLENGSYNFILSTLRPNVVNQEHYNFSELVFEFGPVLVVRQDSTVSSLEEMRGKTIGIPSGFSTAFNAVRAAGAHSYDLLVVAYDNIYQALDAVANDQIDGLVMYALPAYSNTLGLYAGKLKVVTPPFNDEGLRIVALKSSNLSDIIDLIDASLENMHQGGTFKALIAKWDLVDPERSYWQPSEKAKP